MIKRMSFGSLKASFSRRTRRRPRSTISSQNDGGLVANGVMVGTGENKDQVGDSVTNENDPKQRSSALKSKHKGKKSTRGGIWKTLRHKLSRNHRQCWDAGSNPELDLDFVTTAETSQQQQHYRNNKPKPSSVCPMPSGTQANHVLGPSLHVRPPVCSSSDEGVYDEPTFPERSTAMNLSNGVRGADAAVVAKSAAAGGSKTKNRTGACSELQQAGDCRRLEYTSPSKGDKLDTNRSYGDSNNVSGDAASSSSTPTNDCNVVSRLGSCAFASISSFSTPGSPTCLLDYRLENSTPKIRSLTRELFKLSKYGWYWGPITRMEAEEKLMDQPDGAFLVRDSSDDRHLLSLSFRSYGKTLHTRIEHCNGLFSFYAQPEPEGHTSIVDLIEHSMNYSQSGAFCYSRARSPGSPSFPVRLTKPVSRFTQVRTLQYLCRFIIRQYTRFDHIQELPLPSRIKGYIEEGHY